MFTFTTVNTYDAVNDGNLFKQNAFAAEFIQGEFGQVQNAMYEITKFLQMPLAVTDDDLEFQLNSSPVIKKVFHKYNALSSSEADCERLFSYAGIKKLIFEKKIAY